MKRYIYSLLVVLSAFVLNGCSSDAEMFSSKNEQSSENGYRFVINVTKGESTRAANKTAWVEGDIIEAICNRNYVTLTYHAEGYWELSERYMFYNGSDSTIFACYGMVDGWNINPESFLYTDEGYYTNKDNVVYINLNMNKRPFARLTVRGVDKDYSIASLKYPSCVHLREKSFADTIKNATAAEYDESAQTATYYGLIPSTNNQTKILLYNADGVGYSRIYNKVMKGGESVVLNGPNSSEANLWTKHTLVKNITLNETRVNTFIDETFDLKATVEPADADNGKLKWYSSNESIASVDNHGHVTVNGIGEALITVETEDGTQSTNCAVVSRSHASLTLDNLVCANGNGVFEANFTCNYDGSICLKKLYLKHSGNDKVYVLSNVTDGELGADASKYNYNVTLNFNNLPSAIYYLWADYTCNGKTYSIQCTNRYVAP